MGFRDLVIRNRESARSWWPCDNVCGLVAPYPSLSALSERAEQDEKVSKDDGCAWTLPD
jgi:hypothetical protein